MYEMDFEIQLDLKPCYRVINCMEWILSKLERVGLLAD